MSGILLFIVILASIFIPCWLTGCCARLSDMIKSILVTSVKCFGLAGIILVSLFVILTLYRFFYIIFH